MEFNKPAGYDEVQVGEFTPIELGGHKLVIKKLEEVAYNGGKYIKVYFDTASDDIQPNYYTELFNKDTSDNKKYKGIYNLFPLYQGNTSKDFKRFCTSIERSNNSSIEWGAKFEASIVGKFIGGVFGEEEYKANDGTIKTARKLFYWRSLDGLKDATVPDKKTLPKEDNDSWMQVPEGATNLPF